MKNILLILILLTEIAYAANPAVIYGDNNRGLIIPSNGLDFQGGSTLSGQEVIGLKNTMSTGISNGGGSLSIGAPTSTVSISAGVGYVVDNTTDPDVPVITKVNFGPFVNVPLTFIGVAPITIFYINSAGVLEQETSLPTPSKFRDKILLGVAVHQDLATVSDVIDTKVPMNDVALSVKDIADAIGLINTTGNIFSAGGANLTLQKNAGTTFQYGGNATLDPKTPHTNTDLALVPVTTFVYNHRDGIGGYTEITSSVIDPGFHDDGSGTLAAVPANRYTIQRIYYRPSLGTIDVVYGFDLHATLAGAEAAIFGEVTDINPLVSSGTTLRAWLIVKGPTTDLQDIADAKFISAGRFGDTIGGGSTSATTTLQVAYNNSVQPQFVLDATRMGIEILDALTPIGTSLLELWDNAKTTSFFAVDALWAYVQGDPIVVIDSAALDGQVPYVDVNNGAKKHRYALAEKLNEQIKDNQIVNPSYEHIGDSGVLNVAGGVSISGTTSRSSQGSPHNSVAYQIAAVGAYTFDYTRAVTGDFTGRQMVGYCEIRTASPDVKFTIGAHELSVSSNDTWRYYKIAFQGSVDPEIVISNAVSGTDIVKIDNCFLGVSDNETQEVGTAHFVGSATYKDNGSCTIIQQSTNASVWEDFVSNVNCTSTDSGSVTGGDDMSVTFEATAGTRYLIVKTGLMAASNVAGQCRTTFSSVSNTYDDQGIATTEQASGATNSTLNGEFVFATSGSKTIRMMTFKTSTGVWCYNYGLPTLESKITVTAYPDSKSTIVTQDTELTAKTANHFSAWIASNGIVYGDSYDFINGNCVLSGTNNYIKTCQLNDLALAEGLSCVASATSGDATSLDAVGAIATSSTDFSYGTYRSGAGYQFTDVYINCSKRELDVNKNATIIGSFEQIESVLTELTAETANEFIANYDGAGNLSSQSPVDWVSGNCTRTGNGRYYDCAVTLDLTEKMSCHAYGRNDGTQFDAGISFNGTTFDKFDVFINNPITGAAQDYNYQIKCSKYGSDYNKNLAGAIYNSSTSQQEIADIIIENTASDDLVYVRARNSIGGALTATVTPIDFIAVDDVTNSWSGTLFTSTKIAKFSVRGSYITTGAGGTVFVAWVDYNGDGTFTDEFGCGAQFASDIKMFDCDIDLIVGSKVEFRTNANALTHTANNAVNNLTIQELPTQQSIIANLLADSGMVEKCQTKETSAAISIAGAVGDLTFNNLKTDGTLYRLTSHFNIEDTTTAVTDKHFRMNVSGLNLNTEQDSVYVRVNSSSQIWSTIGFNEIASASSSTLTFSIGNIDDVRLTAGSTVTLCEQAGTTITTTEFN